MGFGLICDLVAHARPKGESAAVFELSVQLALDAEKNVAFAAPVVGEVARRVLNHSHANGPELLRAPVCDTAFALVLDLLVTVVEKRLMVWQPRQGETERI